MTMFLIALLFAFGLGPSLSPAQSAAPPSERDTILKACEREFGPTVDGEHGLFDVDRYFLLEARFDDQGRLTQIGILPKHWFADRHPEWDESTDVGELAEGEYTSLLGRLERIRPKGKLVKRAKHPIVGAMTATRRDEYEHAVLVTDDVVDPENDGPGRVIKYFVVYFTATE